jgi:hypothetical protein
MNTCLELPPTAKALVVVAQTAHELWCYLDELPPVVLAAEAETAAGDADVDVRAVERQHRRDRADAWDLWQRLERRAAPLLARALDAESDTPV